MSAFTDFFENKFIDWFFRGQALGINGASAGAGSGPTTLYIGLFTTAPTDSTAGTEVSTSGTGYARVGISSSLSNWAGTQAAGSTTPSSGTGGTTSNNIAIQFGSPTANWGTVTAFGIFDAQTGGNLLIYGNLLSPKTVNSGDAAPSFAISALSFQIDN